MTKPTQLTCILISALLVIFYSCGKDDSAEQKKGTGDNVSSVDKVLSSSKMAGESAGTIITPEISGLLDTLDSLLSDNRSYLKAKEDKIKSLRDGLKTAVDPERRFWLTADLYDEYSAYDSDSALYYADLAKQFAHELNRPDLENEMKLNRSYVLSATGLLDDAEACLREMNVDSLPNHLAMVYCDRMIFLSSHREQYLGEKSSIEGIYAQKADSLLLEMRNEINPENPKYRWLIGWSSLSAGQNLDDAIGLVEKEVKRRDMDTRNDAMDTWMLSKLYEKKGDNQNRLKYLILSATADVRSCNREVASLEELSGLLYDMGEYDRANSYINHSIAYANQYKSRVRLGPLATLQERILSAVHERSREQASINRHYFIGLIIILGVLLLSILYILIQNRLLRKSRRTLNEANAELSKRVEELSQTREELNLTNDKLSEMYEKAADSARELAEVNESKEVYIADVFAVCSNYIDKLEGFRANLNKLLTARKFDEAIKLTKSPELSYQEVRELWATFDEIFLDIFPNFVDDFNSLLRPEEQVELKKPGKLTNELRIYALVRLGMNDSQKISKFLHCSLQTVYNTRQRTRNKARVPRGEFAKAVMALGRHSVRNDQSDKADNNEIKEDKND